MTEWIWTGSIEACGRVCKLRLDPHAQKETAAIAHDIDAELSGKFPQTWSAAMET